MATITLPKLRGPKCRQVHAGFICTRARGHHGRHAASVLGGRVARVWGEDVHADRRERSRAAAAYARFLGPRFALPKKMRDAAGGGEQP